MNDLYANETFFNPFIESQYKGYWGEDLKPVKIPRTRVTQPPKNKQLPSSPFHSNNYILLFLIVVLVLVCMYQSCKICILESIMRCNTIVSTS